ncbi:Bypass of stop codon protein 6 [Cercospora beticola]|uniref:Bypass of stop codon protein 6 n=1 Tax=Cercospora beticola TaxID=122368 RepID=A0A2G5HEJ6_CERBT|nr:Bypass of stop codon protein 6 [Cercospora beticola]PIA90976.1 Bypass of stop codon protein 6 [Cercospora beticola]WPB08137.1 hypothetical protein RHO25_012801 [Cercospora beticola]CAK1367992.1 unnamed protein product [Cercospora beticola]
MSSSSTLTLEDSTHLKTIQEENKPKSPRPTFQPETRRLDDSQTPSVHNDDISLHQILQDNSAPNDGTAVEAKETWLFPRINTYRFAAVCLALFNLGLHDASYGPLIPYLETYYNLNYTTVSLIFLAGFPGYLLAAFASDRIHLKFGQRGLAAFASTCRLAAYIALVCHPPWPVVVVLIAFCGLGNGLLDASWNAWCGDLEHPNELLGVVHALYGLGAAIAPLIASAMTDKYGLPWYRYYLIPLGFSIIELSSGVASFWKANGAEFRKKSAHSKESGGRTRAALKLRVTWTLAVFLLFYVGAEVALSGWVVTFMQRVRGAPGFQSSLTSTGFWLGVTVGRVVLGFVTPRIGERWAIVGYLLAAAGLELLFWLVPQFIVSAVSVALIGFFLGPMFPAAVVVLSKTLPKHLHVGAISFVAALGMGGAAVIPFAVGAIANAVGVKALQPIILAILVILLGMWLTLPKIPKQRAD